MAKQQNLYRVRCTKQQHSKIYLSVPNKELTTKNKAQEPWQKCLSNFYLKLIYYQLIQLIMMIAKVEILQC